MRKVIILSAVLLISFNGCNNLNPLEKLKGPEYFPELGEWIYDMYETRNPNFRWQFQRVQEDWERVKYENNSGKKVEIEVIRTLNRELGSSGWCYTYFYIDASGVYEYSGYDFYPTLLFPAEPGRSWAVEKVRLKDGQGWPVDTRLEAATSLDSVDVPAGEFEALKVELNFYDYYEWYINKQKRLYWKLVRWFAKDYGIVREFDSYIPKYKDLKEFEPWKETGGEK